MDDEYLSTIYGACADLNGDRAYAVQVRIVDPKMKDECPLREDERRPGFCFLGFEPKPVFASSASSAYRWAADWVSNQLKMPVTCHLHCEIFRLDDDSLPLRDPDGPSLSGALALIAMQGIPKCIHADVPKRRGIQTLEMLLLERIAVCAEFQGGGFVMVDEEELKLKAIARVPGKKVRLCVLGGSEKDAAPQFDRVPNFRSATIMDAVEEIFRVQAWDAVKEV